MFWQNEEFSEGLGREIHLDGVLCVVDAVFGRQVSSLLTDTYIVSHMALQQMEEDHAADGIGESLRCARPPSDSRIHLLTAPPQANCSSGCHPAQQG